MTKLKQKLVKTRKPYQCFACLDIFPIGSKMYCEVYAEGSDYNKIYCCEDCKRIMINHRDEVADDADSAEVVFSEGCVRKWRAERIR